MRRVSALFFAVATTLVSLNAHAQGRKALSRADVESIAHLLMLEDQRTYDDTLLSRLIGSAHAEVRRRTAVTIGRLADKRGVALVRKVLNDADTSVVADAVFALGQIHDSSTVPLLDSLLNSPRLSVNAAREAAASLGKIRDIPARASLAAFLTRSTVDTRTRHTIEEALLSIGRVTNRGDIAPIVKWTSSPDEEIRWRATWALFRPRDPAAVSRLIELSKDQSALVRSWAVRGLTRPQADSVALGAQAEAMLIAASSDADRRVSTEAIRALSTYSDSASLAIVSSALQSSDTWIAISGAEGLGLIRNPTSIPLLKETAMSNRPCNVRLVALQSLQAIAPAQMVPSAIAVLNDPIPHCRNFVSAQILSRALNATGAAAPNDATRTDINNALTAMHAARRADLASPDVLVRIGAAKSIATWGDSTDLATLRSMAAQAPKAEGNAAQAAVDAIVRRTAGQGAGGGRGGGGRPNTAAGRDLAFYQRIAEQWVVPDYEGKPRPTSTWTTPKGEIVIELHPGDAPLATDDFVRTIESGAIIGTQFTRVVPDFVNQQESIRNGNLLRDEVSRRRLERTNLAWATAGLDTGNPGYTLNHTPQPHNEGNFTTLGHVIRGMDVVDRTDLGDRILAARMNK